jgi:hypothetical protein
VKIFEIVFMTGETKIVFAESRMAIRKQYIAIREINRIVIH